MTSAVVKSFSCTSHFQTIFTHVRFHFMLYHIYTRTLLFYILLHKFITTDLEYLFHSASPKFTPKIWCNSRTRFSNESSYVVHQICVTYASLCTPSMCHIRIGSIICMMQFADEILEWVIICCTTNMCHTCISITLYTKYMSHTDGIRIPCTKYLYKVWIWCIFIYAHIVICTYCVCICTYC